MKSIVQSVAKHPYYIFVPRYVRTSAGIKAVHLLCHALNASGRSAFVCIDPPWEGLKTNPDWLTPILNQDVLDEHFRQQRTPIVVYPEVAGKNPLQADVRVRWFGNFPGLLGGAAVFDSDEILFSFSRELARATGAPDNVLHIPVLNTSVFNNENPQPRSGSCYYAAKYKEVYGGRVFGLPEGCEEIVRDRPDEQTPEEIADLFRRSELFYCFEDTALANEAALCGCPVVLMPNPFFKKPLAIEEVGWDGYAWGSDPAEIARARATVQNAAANYLSNIPIFFDQLEHFVSVTQHRASLTPYRKPVVLRDVAQSLRDENLALRRELGRLSIEIESLRASQKETDVADISLAWTSRGADMGAITALQLAGGWSQVEEHGVWSMGTKSILKLESQTGVRTVRLILCAYSPKDKTRLIKLTAEDAEPQSASLQNGEEAILELQFKRPINAARIEVCCNAVGTPNDNGDSPDIRPLGVLMSQAWAG